MLRPQQPAPMSSDGEGEDYQFYGTPIEDEEETRAGQHHKTVTAAAATRALPLHQQARCWCCCRCRMLQSLLLTGWSAGCCSSAARWSCSVAGTAAAASSPSSVYPSLLAAGGDR